jgi:hypothetical protein
MPLVRKREDTPLVKAVRDAICGVDEFGRLTKEAASTLRRILNQTSKDERHRLQVDLVGSMGPFEDLPENAQRAIVETITDHDTWRTRGHELGAWHRTLLRLLWRVKHGVYGLKPANSKIVRVARQVSDVLAFGARKGPAQALHMLHERWQSLRGRISARPSLEAAFSFSGIQPPQLAVCFATGIPQREQYRGYWNDQSRHNTVGIVAGVDFIPTSQGCWYVESNLDLAQRPERSALYERDPFVNNLLDFAVRYGYSRLVVMDNNSSGVDPAMASQYEAGADERRLDLTLVDRVNTPGSHRTRSYGIPPIEHDGTLVVRLKSYPTSIDNLFDLKRACGRALELYKLATGDSDLLLPVTSADPILGDIDPDDPYPNVVYKLPELDQARGVYFLKAKSPEHAREIADEAVQSSPHRGLQERILFAMTGRSGLFQPYVKSSLLSDRRLYIIRAHVLITPVGVELLSAHRVVTGTGVPDSLPFGVVSDTRPYLVNFSANSRYEIVPSDEESAVTRAALAVGRGLAWAAEYGFQTTP